MTQRNSLRVGVFFLALFAFSLAAHAANLAAGDQMKMDINITGTISATGKCKFNRAGPLTVDFGPVLYGKNNTLTGSYLQPLISDMTCSGNTGGATMTLSSVSGDTADFSGHKVLKVATTSAATSGLGITLLVNGQAQNIDDSFPVDMKNPPRLEAQLVQVDPTKTFTAGDTLNASATLVMAIN